MKKVLSPPKKRIHPVVPLLSVLPRNFVVVVVAVVVVVVAGGGRGGGGGAAKQDK